MKAVIDAITAVVTVLDLFAITIVLGFAYGQTCAPPDDDEEQST